MVAEALTAPAHAAMLHVCRSWHGPLESSEQCLWEAATMAAFPRVADILAALPHSCFCFKDVYRAYAELQEGTRVVKPALRTIDEYLFTVELTHSCAPGRTIRRTEKMGWDRWLNEATDEARSGCEGRGPTTRQRRPTSTQTTTRETSSLKASPSTCSSRLWASRRASCMCQRATI